MQPIANESQIPIRYPVMYLIGLGLSFLVKNWCNQAKLPARGMRRMIKRSISGELYNT